MNVFDNNQFSCSGDKENALELIKGICWETLRNDKQWLLAQSDAPESLIALIDAIQDFAVDCLGEDESKVFFFDDD